MRLACLQTAGTPGDPDANLAELDAAAREAAEGGAELLVTPELFLTGYDIGDQAAELARRPLLAECARIARTHGIGLVIGAPHASQRGLSNVAVFLDDTGELLGMHAKTQLFGELDRERFRPGDDSVTMVRFRGVSIALLICYDVEFPETVRAAALRGAELIAVPTAQMEPFSFVAETVLPTRAWENQVYVCYVNHVGSERDTHYVGRSGVYAPDGSALARAGTERELLHARIDPKVVAEAQLENPYLTDLRRDFHY